MDTYFEKAERENKSTKFTLVKQGMDRQTGI
jgi:hypothetical protein